MTPPSATHRRAATALITALSVTTLIGAVAITAPADAAGSRPSHGDPHAARDWLLGQIDPASGGIPGFAGADWGLTIDTLWAVKANGGSSAQVQGIWSAVSKHAKDYAGPVTYGDVEYITAGASAKVLFAAATTGADPTRLKQADGSTLNILDQTTKLVATSGPEKGRLKDPEASGYDSTNIFSQSLAVLGFIGAGTHKTNPSLVQSTVDFLARQECSAGWFPMFYPDDKTCDQQNAAGQVAPDNDGTAMALQAMLAAKKAGLNVPDGATEMAVSFLVSVQKSDGSFGGGVSTEGSNSNSTGLVASALYQAGQTGAAARAGQWVAGLQWTGTGTALDADRGVIGYDAASFADAKTSGTGFGIDQWRRATAQAVFALHPVPLIELVGPVDPPASTQTPTASSTTTATTSPTSTTTTTAPAPSTSTATSAPSSTSAPPTTTPGATSEPTSTAQPSSTSAPSSSAASSATTSPTSVQPPRRPSGSGPTVRVTVPDVRTVISRAIQHSGGRTSPDAAAGADPMATQPGKAAAPGGAQATQSPTSAPTSTSTSPTSTAPAQRATPQRDDVAAAAPARSDEPASVDGRNWWPLGLAVAGGSLGALLLLIGLNRRGQQ